MLEKIFDELLSFFEPVINWIATWTFVTVSLHAAPTFKENKKGQWHQSSGSAVIMIINRKKEPLKINDIGIIFTDGTRASINFLLPKSESTKTIVDGRDNKIFHLKREELLKLGFSGIMSIQRLYMTDSNFQEYTSSVPKMQKRMIVISLKKQMHMINPPPLWVK
jgi:hypothetical protein